MPFIEKKYSTYESYSRQKITDIFTPSELKNALKLRATMFESCFIENLGNNRFRIHPLPREAQFSPVYSILAGDFNNDGKTDLIVSGNFFGTRIKFGEYDANKGLLLFGDGKGGFVPASDTESGIFIRGEVRDAAEVKTAGGKDIFVFALNNDSAKVYGYARKR